MLILIEPASPAPFVIDSMAPAFWVVMAGEETVISPAAPLPVVPASVSVVAIRELFTFKLVLAVTDTFPLAPAPSASVAMDESVKLVTGASTVTEPVAPPPIAVSYTHLTLPTICSV